MRKLKTGEIDEQNYISLLRFGSISIDEFMFGNNTLTYYNLIVVLFTFETSSQLMNIFHMSIYPHSYSVLTETIREKGREIRAFAFFISILHLEISLNLSKYF